MGRSNLLARRLLERKEQQAMVALQWRGGWGHGGNREHQQASELHAKLVKVAHKHAELQVDLAHGRGAQAEAVRLHVHCGRAEEGGQGAAVRRGGGGDGTAGVVLRGQRPAGDVPTSSCFRRRLPPRK